MFAYRERRPRASAIAGAAEVHFLTAGNIELNADLAMNAVVGFATVSHRAHERRMRSKLMPVSTSTPETKIPGNAVPIAPRALRLGNPQKR